MKREKDCEEDRDRDGRTASRKMEDRSIWSCAKAEQACSLQPPYNVLKLFCKIILKMQKSVRYCPGFEHDFKYP